jgi:hypothetical protein
MGGGANLVMYLSLEVSKIRARLLHIWAAIT